MEQFEPQMYFVGGGLFVILLFLLNTIFIEKR